MARLSGRQTPVVAIAFTTLIAAALILTGELGLGLALWALQRIGSR